MGLNSSRRHSRLGIWLLAFLIVAGLNVESANSQILYGGLVGNVTDESGAAIPGAQINITHDETGATRAGESNAAGGYSFSTLATGNYTIEVQSDGFRTHNETEVAVTANNVTRVDIGLQIGAVTETVEVVAGAARLQTDRAEVRAEISKTDLQSVPVPLGRNYQMLMQTIPGFSPPRNAHSVPANPTRAVRFSVNGTSEQNNNVRIDGASSYNPNLTHMQGINPALESIEVVNVVTNSFDAEQGLAGGAAINLQIKSGTNAVHGSGFWYHNNQKIQAFPYFKRGLSQKPKFIYNQAGATIGGPIQKNKIFYFMSYERTAEHSNATRLQKVPDAAMRAGDFSASPRPIFDPFSAAIGKERDRTAFANNIIPTSRIDNAAGILAGMTNDWHLPNLPGTGSLGLNQNYLAGITYAFDRHQLDGKTNFNINDKWTAFARLSFFYYDQVNPGAYGILSGQSVHPTNFRTDNGFGPTYQGTLSTTYVAKPNLIFDAYFGAMLLDSNAFAGNLDQRIGLDVLGIPGTNGDGVPGEAGSFYGGMPRMRFDSGFGNLGYQATSPFIGHDFQYQLALNGNWTKGKHEVRFGTDNFLSHINQEVANFPGGDAPAGGFRFRRNTSSRPGTGVNDFNAIASFMLGLPREAARNFLTGKNLQTRSTQYSLYIRDRYQMKPNLTLTYGTRWEYFPFPVGPDRGLERFDAMTNEMLVCGIGSIPRNCDLPQSKKLFAPRIGIAWRVTDSLVARAGYGITYDPFNLGRDLRGNLPRQFSQALPVPNSRSYSTTLADGFPDIPAVPLDQERIPMPLNANVAVVDSSYSRGYVQSWNFTMEKQVGTWIASAGYVATRSIRQSARLEQNWSPIGTGSRGRVLRQLTGRTANTLIWGALGTPKYDALQATIKRRYANGHTFNLAYTWSHGRGYTSEGSTAQPIVRNPLFYDRNYGSLNQDLRHNLVISNAYELPFGKSKRFANSGPAAAVLGGWQINGLASFRTGRPSTPRAPTGSLNSQGSGQLADCLSDVRKIGTPEQWWDPSGLADPADVGGTPRFGTCGTNVLRGPGLINVDMGVFRKFQITEKVDLQFRAEAFNLSNTPHFNNPNSDISSSRFGQVTSMQNTGREGLDQRIFRFGLRLGW